MSTIWASASNSHEEEPSRSGTATFSGDLIPMMHPILWNAFHTTAIIYDILEIKNNIQINKMLL